MPVTAAFSALSRDLERRSKAINAYHDRAVEPEQTLAGLRRYFPALGITRVGLITGLDVIGIPVAFATRPNSQTLSVFQGKGMNNSAAMTSAAMEALETRIAENRPAGLRMAHRSAVQRSGNSCIDLDRVARCVPDEIGEDALPWTEGLDLVSGASVLVPWSLVGLDHRGRRPPGFEISSDGLASGNSPCEAVLHGLCELIERDCWALMQLRADSRLRQLRTDPRGFGDAVIDVMVGRIEACGMRLLLLDMTSDIGVPAYLATIVPGKQSLAVDARWSQICGGCGCHPDPARAALRAILEAAQSRLTAIAGSRDDFSAAIYNRVAAGGVLKSLTDVFEGVPCPPRQADAVFRPDSIQSTLADLCERLRRGGIGQIIAVPLETPDASLSVVRVLVPGLEVELGGENIQLGLRGLSALEEEMVA